MIDKCPLFIFLNTENSNFIRNGEIKTFSPWLYHEINMSSFFSKKKTSILESMKEVIEFKLDLTHLSNFDSSNLSIIKENWDRKSAMKRIWYSSFYGKRGTLDFLLEEMQN